MYLVELSLSRAGVVLEEISDTGLEGITGGSTQLEYDLKGSLEVLRRPLVHGIGLERQLKGGGHGCTITTQCLDTGVVVFSMAVLTSRPVAGHYPHRCPPLNH